MWLHGNAPHHGSMLTWMPLQAVRQPPRIELWAVVKPNRGVDAVKLQTRGGASYFFVLTGLDSQSHF